MRFGDCTWPEIKRYADDGAVAIVPFGCTEQQGPHLPVDFDTWFAEDVTTAAADRLQRHGVTALVLPAVPFGPTPEHRAFGYGYVDLPLATHGAIARATFDSLAAQGFATIVAWRGCGGHDLRKVADKCGVHLPEPPLSAFWAEVGAPVASGHADSFTTSISLYRRPESVRRELVPAEPSKTPDWDDPQLDFAAYSSTGVVGLATEATAERGAALWERCVDWLVDYVRPRSSNPGHRSG